MDQRPDDLEATSAMDVPPEPAEATEGTAATPAAPRSRARWLIGGGIAVAAVAALVLIVSFLGGRPLPEALRYIPADSALVVEIRPELPGDQRQHLGNFLAHFPGFADQSILGQKIDEALGRMIRSSGAPLDY
ncbi:MAG: hypothetical protein ABIV26_00685, partial [Candidatus Limnocylindrales bacterium]